MANSPIGSTELHNEVPAIWNADGTLRTPDGGSVAVGGEPKYPMPKTRRMMARVTSGQGHGNILCVGDSTTAGQYANNSASNLGLTNARNLCKPAGLSSHLARAGINVNFGGRCGDAASFQVGSTLSVYDTGVALGASYTGGNFSTVGGNAIYAASTTALGLTAAETATITPVDSFDTVDVYWLRLGTGGTFTIDCGGAVLATCSPGVTSLQKTTVNKTAGTGVVNFIRTATGSGGNGIYICSVVPYLSTKKCINILPAGACGFTSQGWISGGQPASPLQMLPSFGQDLTIINLGLNDANSSFTYAQTYANLLALGTAAKTVGDVLFEVPNDVGVSYSVRLPTQVQAILDVAEALQANVISIQDRQGTFSEANALGYMYTDQTHQLQIGYWDTAKAESNLLLNL